MSSLRFRHNDNTLEKVHDLLYYYSYSFVDSLGSAGYEQSNIDIDINLPESDTPVIGEVYPGTGYNTTLSNFAATYGGIMVPPVTGEYKFSIDDVSDGAAIFVFTNRDMYCCEDLLFSNWINKTANFYYIPDDSNYQTNSITVNLEANRDYLVLITYINQSKNVILKTSLTTPSGEAFSNYTGFMHRGYESFTCKIANITTSLVSEWTEAYATTYSTEVFTTGTLNTLIGLEYTDILTIYYIMTPPPTPSSSTVVASSTIVSSSSYLTSSSSIITSSSFSSSIEQSSETLYSSMLSSVISSSLIVSNNASSIEQSFTTQSSYIPTSRDSSIIKSSLILTFEEVSSSSTTLSSNLNGGFETDGTESSSKSSYATNSVSSDNSHINSFSNFSSIRTTPSNPSTSLSTALSTKHSTGIKLFTSTVVNGDVNHSQDDNTNSTATYTDTLGVIKTTIVSCPTKSHNNKSVIETTPEFETTATDTGATEINDNTILTGVISNLDNPATKTVKAVTTNKSKEHRTVTTANPSKISSSFMQVHSLDVSSVSSVEIQRSPNAANKHPVRLFFSFFVLTCQIFFI
ncbi:hypothetical protein C6P45_002662 [Maudiozyma exigua]|uniref:PA14 domain-containing protein n=1 Tax=Maudiozyma exigua TaxID=34358 RepID=A0A9P7B370_MAUEX|nr:hypothetical protein C6P45_002662 [Kazachstania exigua]